MSEPNPIRLFEELKMVLDYIGKLESQNRAMRMEIETLRGRIAPDAPERVESASPRPDDPQVSPPPQSRSANRSAPGGRVHGFEGDACPDCGAITMVRNGACLKCVSCGATSGCS